MSDRDRWWMFVASILVTAIGCQHVACDFDGIVASFAFFFGGAAAVHFVGPDP